MNRGLTNERKIIERLNNKYIYQLSFFWKKFMFRLFPFCCENDIITCIKAEPHKKEDIIIKVNKCVKTVSIKSGYYVSVHSETINHFCGFLKFCGISEESINTLRLYHFGDGTIDGTGEDRIGVNELVDKYKKEIMKFNIEVNNPIVLKEIILRLINHGTLKQRSKVDYIYYGNEISGIYCDMNQLCDYLTNRPFNKYIQSIHFGPFTYNNHSRNLSKTISKGNPREIRKYYCNIKWGSIVNDLKEFTNKFPH